MKGIFLVIFLLGGSLFSFGQVEREVGDFSSLKVYDRISVELIASNKHKVEILGDDDGRVEIVNKNGELKIRTKIAKFLKGKGVRVRVYYNDINDIQASQGAIITSDEILKANVLKLTSNEGSSINIEIKVNQLTARGNSGGEIDVLGYAESQSIVINSGAVFRGKNLKSEEVEVSVNAGGIAEVNALESVNATVRAGGNIEIYGNPKSRNTKKIIGNIIFK